MGILVQLVIAALAWTPGFYLWLVVLSYLVEPGAALVLAAVASSITSLWFARWLYWRHERKRQAISYVYYPPNVLRDPERVHTRLDLNSRVHK